MDVKDNKSDNNDQKENKHWNYKVNQPVYKYAGYDPPSKMEWLRRPLNALVSLLGMNNGFKQWIY